MNPLLRRMLCCLLWGWVVTIAAAQPQADRPWNFVFILVDDLGWADLGCYGSTFYETPNLDALAGNGMRFTDAYAASPVCSPTRAALLTGKYPMRVKITDWIPGDDPKDRPLLGPVDRNELPLEEVTIAEALQQRGYQTFFAGKWHLGGEGFLPEQQGFAENKGGYHIGQPPGGYYSPYRNPKLADGPNGEYLTDRLTDESIRFIESNRDRPFFLYLSFYTVHTPIQACERHLARFQEKASRLPGAGEPVLAAEKGSRTRVNQSDPAYASMVYAMDENVGRLLHALTSAGLDDRTVVIFTSDNGGLSTLSGERWVAPTASRPLRGGKGWCYEGGIRVPLIIRAPGLVREGAVCREPVISMDFYPTILELSNTPLPAGHTVDGLSLLPLLQGGKKLERPALVWHYPHYHGSGWTPGAALRQGPWKLITFYESGVTELYNLDQDPGEQHDLASREPDLTARLLKLLTDIQVISGAQLPTRK